MIGNIKIIATITLFVGYATCEDHTISSYRNGYVKIDNAFYKYQEVVRNWIMAKEICEEEGATLFYPESEEEKETVKQKILHPKFSRNRISSPSYLHIGAYDANGTGRVLTVDNELYHMPLDSSNARKGSRLCMAVYYDDMKIVGSHCGMETNYICKAALTSLRWNEPCKMVVPIRNQNDYEYNSELKKCYKLHSTPKTWHRAKTVCAIEQSTLVELNSQEEADHLMSIVARMPENAGLVCLGFQNSGDGWKTLSGLPLRKSGYALWAHTQPDGDKWETYGAMTYNGRLHDISEHENCIFVCEHNPGKTKP